MTWNEQAADKLEREAKAAKLDRYGNVMKSAVLKKLKFFCGQDEEFAQAVVQGGSFEKCMEAVSKMVKGNSIEDFVAYEEAVRFYFPGAGIRCTMEIDLCAAVEEKNDGRTGPSAPTEDKGGAEPRPYGGDSGGAEPRPYGGTSGQTEKKAVILNLADYL